MASGTNPGTAASFDGAGQTLLEHYGESTAGAKSRWQFASLEAHRQRINRAPPKPPEKRPELLVIVIFAQDASFAQYPSGEPIV